MPDYNKLCFHGGAHPEVISGQKSGDYMCDDDCGASINSRLHERPTEDDLIRCRYNAITDALNKIFDGATPADVAKVDKMLVNDTKTEYIWEGTVMPFRFDEFKKRAEAIATEARRIGWKGEVETGTLKGDPRRVLTVRIKKPAGVR